MTRDSPCLGGKKNRTKGVDWSKHLAFPYLVMKSQALHLFRGGGESSRIPWKQGRSNIYVPAGSDHSDTELMKLLE